MSRTLLLKMSADDGMKANRWFVAGCCGALVLLALIVGRSGLESSSAESGVQADGHSLTIPEPRALEDGRRPSTASPNSASNSNQVERSPTSGAADDVETVVGSDEVEAKIFQLARAMPDLREVLRLSAAEELEFLRLLATQDLRAERTAPVVHYSLQGHVTNIEQPSQEALRTTREQSERELQGMLGEDRYEAWRNYLFTRNARIKVSELRKALELTGEPLRGDQVAPLVESLAEAETRVRGGQEVLQLDESDFRARTSEERASQARAARARMVHLNNGLVEAAQPYLSPVQMRVFEKLLTAQVEIAGSGHQATPP